MGIVDRLIVKARRTPYLHLNGYMNRYWLVPYKNGGPSPTQQFQQQKDSYGCGPVNWKRPLAKLLQAFGIAVRLHCILRSDKGRNPHNHPWKFYMTLILKGGYWEDSYDGKGRFLNSVWCGPGTIRIHGRKHFHILRLPSGETWTMFITGPRDDIEQPWGFMVDGQFVPRERHVEEV